MTEQKFKTLLSNVCIDNKVTKFEFCCEKSDTFTSLIYCKLNGENYDEQCCLFVQEFSKATQTNWIVFKMYGKQVRNLFRKTYRCQHSQKNKSKHERKYKNRIRDRKCDASIDFKFKKINRVTGRLPAKMTRI